MTTTTHARARDSEPARIIPIMPICSDLTDDCNEVIDKLHCWFYDMSKGRCPFLAGDAK